MNIIIKHAVNLIKDDFYLQNWRPLPSAHAHEK